MKPFVVFLLVEIFITLVSSSVLRNNSDTDGWLVPNLDGTLFWMSRKLYEAQNNQRTPRTPVSVRYFLADCKNFEHHEELFIGDVDALARSSFNKEYPTKIFIHGWEHYTDDLTLYNELIPQALMKQGNLNLIIVDWRSQTSLVSYHTSKNAVPSVGIHLASFLDFLSEKTNVPLENFTLICESLGGHVCGYAGKNVNRGKIGVISGMDPAFPLYDYSNCETRLCITDAVFVETIQTNVKVLGFLEPIGTASYYPNGGLTQPGCGVDLGGMCSHMRSVNYFAEALLNRNFRAIKCENYQAAVSKNCKDLNGGDRMGSLSNHGVYYVPVNKKSLFGTGSLLN